VTPSGNIAIARRVWEGIVQNAAAARGRAFSDPAWHPEVEYVEDPSWPGSGTYRGADRVGARFSEYLEILGEVAVEVEEVREVADDLVLSIWRMRGKTTTGYPYEQEWAWLWTFADGRIIRWQAFLDNEAALEAAGVRE
jgi:ketosteroid isomerase-like protein